MYMLTVVLMSPLIKAEVVLRTSELGALVVEMLTKRDQLRLSRAEGEMREVVVQGLLFQVEEVAPSDLEEVMLSMVWQVKLFMVQGRNLLEQLEVLLDVDCRGTIIGLGCW